MKKILFMALILGLQKIYGADHHKNLDITAEATNDQMETIYLGTNEAPQTQLLSPVQPLTRLEIFEQQKVPLLVMKSILGVIAEVGSDIIKVQDLVLATALQPIRKSCQMIKILDLARSNVAASWELEKIKRRNKRFDHKGIPDIWKGDSMPWEEIYYANQYALHIKYQNNPEDYAQILDLQRKAALKTAQEIPIKRKLFGRYLCKRAMKNSMAEAALTCMKSKEHQDPAIIRYLELLKIYSSW